MGDFFDNFPEFYHTSSVGSGANRLNSRHRVLIEENKNLIRDKSVLIWLRMMEGGVLLRIKQEPATFAALK